MLCPNCGYPFYVSNDGCFECGYSPCIGPGSDTERLDEITGLSMATPEPIPMFQMPWKNLCPACHSRTFDGWDCNNPNCNYGIPEKERKMVPRILSPEESAALRKQLDIP